MSVPRRRSRALAGSAATVRAESGGVAVAVDGAGVEVAPDIDVEVGSDELLDTPWQVVIYNDPVNLMNYVTVVIRKVFGYPEERARQLMLDVHHKGRAIVWAGEREKAELYVQQLQSYQLLAAMERID